jgi:hypothetical protein
MPRPRDARRVLLGRSVSEEVPMSGSRSQSTARVLSQEEIPQPPPPRRRRASILVRTIGDLSAREVAVEDEVDAGLILVRTIGGAKGSDDEVVASGVVRIIGGANGCDDDELVTAVGVIPVIGGANGRDD